MFSSQKVYGWCVENRNSHDPHHWPESWEDYEIEADPQNGGAGTVHPVKGKQLVAKLFQQHILEKFQQDDNMARRLIALALNHDRLKRELPFVKWPERVLYAERSNNADDLREGMVGFSMERLTGMNKLGDILCNPGLKFKLTAENGLRHTLHLALTIAGQLQQLHRHEFRFVFADLTPNNIFVDAKLERVIFIDPDSYQFDCPDSKDKFGHVGFTEGYSSPESHRAITQGSGHISPAHDAFVFAILLFHLLMAHKGFNNVHPFIFGDESEDEHIRKGQFLYGDGLRETEAIPHLSNAYLSFPAEFRAAFERTFVADPQQVMSLSEWITIREWAHA